MEIHRRLPERRPYPPPRKNVLLLSCMDLRLLDDICAFMEGDNLANRYDQLVFAGAALGVIQPTHASWRDVFFQHLDIAVALHDIRDVYIMEHRHCGAYEKFLGAQGRFDDSEVQQAAEEAVHRRYAMRLKTEIDRHCQQKLDQGGEAELWTINVRCFLMDLRGSVRMLDPNAADYEFS